MATITSAQQTQIVKIVSGLFNAAPGATYLSDFSNFIAAGNTMAQLANALAASSTFTTSVMAGKVTVESQVQQLMTNFGLTYGATDAAAVAAQTWFTAQINAGQGFGAIVYNATTALNDTAWVTANSTYASVANQLTNKAAVAEYYSSTLATSSTSLSALQAVVSGVTATTFTVTNGVAATTATTLAAAITASGTSAGTTYTLTVSTDTISGSVNNDTIDASRSISGGVAFNTLANADTIDGGAGTDTLSIQMSENLGITPGSIKNVEVVSVELMSANALALNLINGDASVTTINSSNAVNALTVSNVQAAVSTINISNTGQNFTATMLASKLSGTADALAMTITNQTAGTDSVGGTSSAGGYETINLTSAGTVTNVLTLDDGASTSLATVNVAGATAMTLTMTPATVTTVNASTMTAALSVAAVTGNAQAMTVTGGTANDTINVGVTAGDYTTADSITGGSGTDTLVLLNAAFTAATATQSNVSGIEVISVGGLSGTGSLVTFGATGTIFTADTAAHSTLNYAAGTSTLNTMGFDDGGNNYTLAINAAGSATTDVLTLTLGSSSATLGTVVGSGAWTIGGFETVNIVSQSAANSFAGALTLTNTGAVESVVLTGTQNFTVTGALTADVVNASGMTGSGALIMTGAGGANSMTITGTANADTIGGGASADVLSGGSGADVIAMTDGDDIITGGAGGDIFDFQLITAAADANAGTGSAVTDYTIGTDHMRFDVSALLTDSTATGATTAVTAAEFFSGAAGNMTAGTAYAITVLTAVGYSGVGTAEDAVAAQSTAAKKGIVIYYDTTDSVAKGFYDADIGADGNLTATAQVVRLTGVTTLAALSSFTASDFYIQA